MKKTMWALALMLVMAVLASTVGLEFVEIAVADPYIPPEKAPSGYRINSDGTYDAENLLRDGDVYTFTGDINCTIVIERNGVVLDGAGYTLLGNASSSGIWLQDRRNVTIKNLSIQNFDHGIKFSHYIPNRFSHQKNPNYPTNCTIYACNITNNTYGLSLSCLNCSVLGNYIANNTYGITFYGSGNTFRNNTIEENQYNFQDQNDGANDVDTSNTVDGKPIYYWVNQHNMTVPADAGLVVLKNCSSIKVQNLNLTRNRNGITLYYTNDSKIYGNSVSDNRFGIALYESSNNSIIGNQVMNNSYGIYQQSDNNTISNNMIKANGNGIYGTASTKNNVISSNQIIANENHGVVIDSTNCTITDNYIFGNLGTGIHFYYLSSSVIIGNNVTLNGGSGISFYRGIKSRIQGNYISKNDMGISNGEADGNIITSNNIIENTRWGIRFVGTAKNNLIHHNNFIDNNNKSIQVLFIPGDPAANSWDDGVEGNYWSDYTSRYPDAQKVENSTVGNTAYYIEENNQDNYPLLEPLEFVALHLPSIQPPQEDDPTPTEPPATFPALVIACIASAATTSIGLLIYFKKRK